MGAGDEDAGRRAGAAPADLRCLRGRGDRGQDDEARKALLTFVVVGGGPTGVEIAGQIAELSRRALAREVPALRPQDVRVILFDGWQGDPRHVRAEAARHAAKAHANWNAQALRSTSSRSSTHVDAEGVEVKGPDGEIHRYAARTKIWAAGVSASPLAAMLGERLGRGDWTEPGASRSFPTARLPGHPEVFAVGDMMALNGLPGVGRSRDAVRNPRRPDHQGASARSGAGAAPALPLPGSRKHGCDLAAARDRELPRRVRLWGFPAWVMWLVVHVTFMTGFKNRFSTLLHWSMSFLGRGRTQRAMIGGGGP